MADENIKDYTTTWILFGVLIFSMLSFAMYFMTNNNPTGLGTSGDVFESTASNLGSTLYAVEETQNEVLNITSNTNPEISDLGSRDSVAVGFNVRSSGQSVFQSTLSFMAWILGDVGINILSIIAGIMVLTGAYWIWRFIRTGT